MNEKENELFFKENEKMTEKQLKESMLCDVKGAIYWLSILREKLENDDTIAQQLDWLIGYIVNYDTQIKKNLGAYEMLQESAEKENEK